MKFFFSLMITLLATPVLIMAAHRYGWLDHPDERKHHEGAVPMVGGLAMSLAIAALSGSYLSNTNQFAGLFVATSIIASIGFMDDCRGLGIVPRFTGQFFAAVVVSVYSGLQLDNLGNLLGLGTIALGGMAVAFTVFAVVGLTNAFNLSDGMDGLAGGLALIAVMYLGCAAYLTGMLIELDALLIFGGALIGFLYFNMRFPWQNKARVFMGDAGSLIVGFLLAWSAISVTQHGGGSLPPAAALWFFAIPLWDTVSLMLRRILKGKSPFHPGRDHLHHVLLRVGYRDCQVVHFIHLAALVCGLIGFLGWRWGVPDAVLFYGFLAMFALYAFGVQHAWRLMRLLMPLHRHD